MTPPLEDVTTVLLVEPDRGDANRYTESFADLTEANDVYTVGDGETALEFVRQRGEYADGPRPDIVLLDFQLPGLGGEAVLSELKSDPELRSIPVIVLTTPGSDEEVVRSYELHANASLQKPTDSDGIASLVRSLESFWLTFVRFPRIGA